MTMNGATSKSFMRNLSGSDFTSHKNKKRFFEAADINKAVGMQKGKHLFTNQHSVSPSPAVDQVTPAHSEGRGVKTDIYSMQQGKNTPRPIGGYTAEEQKARINVEMNKDLELDTKDKNIGTNSGGRMARQEGTALEGSSNSEEDDTTKDKKERINLNIQPGKASIVAMKRGCYTK